MPCNGGTFPVLSYEGSKEITTRTEYQTKKKRNIVILFKRLGINMSDDKLAPRGAQQNSRRLIEEYGRLDFANFKDRKAEPMMILFKPLMLSRTEYYCVLVRSVKAVDVVEFENM